ncbi:MAG: twin-arginine translocation signal domain-containing protein [Kiritimatiellae bacterium]|nr:twin-arginine translocation signal domain-containing protein [Kiritimatiellia bacterium]
MQIERRGFLKGMAAAAACAATPTFAAKPAEIRAMLFHWGLNQWGESLPEGVKTIAGGRRCNDKVQFSDEVWKILVKESRAKKMNTLVIDLGEFPVYPSHPELAVKGSRKPEWVLGEVKRLKSLGFEVIPKLNFSAGHDAWLGEYSRMLTTKPYYQTCRDVIRDAYEMFDRPRCLHIGYDEESFGHQRGFKCVRTDELWWHDFLFFVNAVEKHGMRVWMWSDYGWRHAEFAEKCPLSVVQNNWYYDEWMEGFDLSKMSPKAKSRPLLELFEKLDKRGFDQVPCSSNWCSDARVKAKVGNDECMANLVKFCRKHVSPAKLKGFMMAPWTNCAYKGGPLTRNLQGIAQLAAALR